MQEHESITKTLASYLLVLLDSCFLFETTATTIIIATAINTMMVSGTTTSEVMRCVETVSTAKETFVSFVAIINTVTIARGQTLP